MKRMLAMLTLAAVVAVPAHAQFAKVEDAVKYRKSALSVMETHFSRISAVVKGEKPYDNAAVAADAALVETLSTLPWSAFPADSETSDSKARPEIWKEQDKFKSAAEKMQTEVAKLSTAAKSGDLAAIKTAFGAAGQSCKACHDDFRRK
jgi:cytochrome c556